MITKNKTKGLLYYAHNNKVVNYLRLAICSALTARYQLKDFRAMIVTDEYSIESLTDQDKNLLQELFEHIKIDDTIFNRKNYRVVMHVYENKGMHHWHNRTRPNAYEDSIYDETILVDADFIFQDNNLDKLWGSSQAIMMPQHFISLLTKKNAKRTNLLEIEMLSNFTIPLYWATLVYFCKGQFAKQFFSTVNYIHDNYDYYKELYQLEDSSYRNDHAFTIALQMMNGFVIPGPEYEIPFKYILTTTMDRVYRINKASTKFILNTRDWKNPWHLINIKGLSYHCLDKVSLLMKYEQFLEVYAGIKQSEKEPTTDELIQEVLKEITDE